MTNEDIKPVVKRLAPEQKMEKNASYIIFHSDDFDGQLDNKKVLALMLWDGIFGFVGGTIEDDNVSLKDNVMERSKTQINFDVKKYEDDIKHVSSYDYNGFGIHTYACKISVEDMHHIRMNQYNTEENIFDYSGAVVFNISPETARQVLSNNFGGMSGKDLFEVIDTYMSSDFEKANEIAKKEQEEEEKAQLVNEVTSDPEAYKAFEQAAKEMGIDVFADPNSKESQAILDENGEIDEDKLREYMQFPRLPENEVNSFTVKSNIPEVKETKKENKKGFLRKLIPS